MTRVNALKFHSVDSIHYLYEVMSQPAFIPLLILQVFSKIENLTKIELLNSRIFLKHILC